MFYLEKKWTLSGAATLGQSEPGSNGNEKVVLISQSSYITGAPPSDCSCHIRTLVEGALPLCSDAVGVFYCSS